MEHFMLIHEQGPVGLLFIPAWLDQALVDNNKPMSALLNVEELRTFLTMDDLANYLHINRRIAESNTELVKAFNYDFAFVATSPYTVSNKDVDFKYFEDIELAIELLKNSTSNIGIEESVKSNLLPTLDNWELKSLVGEVDIDAIKQYGLYSFNSELIHNNVYGIRFTTELGEDSSDYRTYVSLDNLLKNISQYYDFRRLVGYKTFQTYLKYMDLVN